MNKKIICIGIISMFLMTGLTVVSALKNESNNTAVATDNLNRPPEVQFILDADYNCHQTRFKPGEKIYFIVKGSDPDGDELTYTVEWSRTGPKETVEGNSHDSWFGVDHTYSSMGIYHATCTAKDGRGGEDSYFTNVKVTKPESESPTPKFSNILVKLLDYFPFLEHLLNLPAFR